MLRSNATVGAAQRPIDYFMPSILTITGDPGIVLCDFWFGGAFPSKTDRNVSGDALGEQQHGDRHGDRALEKSHSEN